MLSMYQKATKSLRIYEKLQIENIEKKTLKFRFNFYVLKT